MVRDGEISSRELVEASLERIEALDPELNAFIYVDADERARSGRRRGAGRRAAVRRRADRDQGHCRAGGGLAAGRCGSDLLGDFRARPRRLARPPDPRGGLRDRRQDQHARVRDPAGHRAAPLRRERATRGTRSARPAARRAAPARRSPPASCRSRTAATAAARSGSRPPAAGSWASSPRAAASRAGRTWARTSSSSDGVLTPHGGRHRGAARRDGRATSRATRPGPRRRPSPSPVAAAREPGRLRIGMTTAIADRGGARPARRARPCATPPSCSTSLGHEVEEFDAPWGGEDLLPVFTTSWAPTWPRPWCSAGWCQRPRADRRARRAAVLGGVGDAPARRSAMDYLWPALAAAGRRARPSSAPMGRYDVLLMPALGAAAGPDRRDRRRAAPNPLGRLRAARGQFTPYTAHLQRERAAGDLAAALPRRRRPADRRPARRPSGRRGHAAVARRPARGRPPVGGPPAGPRGHGVSPRSAPSAGLPRL